ncbi:MAG: FKBP-type peptidyl-prolyl cis-trans isomerase [Opitutaceae bacterium]|nr:FKBP-type peptidyl-prolyl cis-trans isomerase [Opitutaceae bacterium]
MKLKLLALLSLFALGAAATRAQAPQVSLPGQTAPAPAFTDAQLVEEFGWFIGKRVGLTELEFSATDLDILLKGIRAAAMGKDSPYELEKIGPAMDEFMQKRQSAYLAKLKTKNESANAAYFTKLKENKAVVALPSGLHYEIVKEGTGPAPKPTDTVKVHYIGRLLDGTEFDSSIKRNEPAEFSLDQVIPGWTEGIQKVTKGGKIKLYVPPALGYGDQGNSGIPPGSTLVFEVDLLDIKSATPAPAAPAPATKK